MVNENTASQSMFNGVTAACTRAMAMLRLVVGGGSLVLPTLAGTFSGIAPRSNTVTMTRLFGVRDFALALALLTAQRQDSQPLPLLAAGEARRNLRRVLWIGILVDAVDMCSCVAGVVDGSIDVLGMWTLGGGALAFVCAGIAGLSATG